MGLKSHGPDSLDQSLPSWAGIIRPGRPAFEVAEIAAWEGRAVGAVDLQGRKETSEELVRRRIRTAVGSPLAGQTVGADVARLANLGAFADVRAEVTETSGPPPAPECPGSMGPWSYGFGRYRPLSSPPGRT